MSASSKKSLYFIGYNNAYEFGLGHRQRIVKLHKCTFKTFKKVFCGHSYNLFTDSDKLDNLWSAGANYDGDCGVGKQYGNSAEEIETYTQIKYFKQNSINITKIFLNPTASCTFFQSDTNKIYACGRDILTSINPNSSSSPFNLTTSENAYQPTLIPQLQNVIDIQSCDHYKIALCTTQNDHILMIIQNWSRQYQTPQDIINLLLSFTKLSIIYATSTHPGVGHPQHIELTNKFTWNQVHFFDDKNIIKIAVGGGHTLFLDQNGNIWSCGQNYYNVNGWMDKSYIDMACYVPRRIKYFMQNKIKIKDIQCGASHSLALDVDGMVYSWGYNGAGECGVGAVMTENEITEPMMIEDLKEYKVEIIRCGVTHNYVRTECNKHYMFGSNDDWQCLWFKENDEDDNGDYLFVKRPYRIDPVVRKECVGDIVDVFVGYHSTKILVTCL